jgi:RNA-directed DNA polymerase
MSLTRQQLYDRIRETSKDSYVLEEMKRLGFWEDSPQPTVPEMLIKKEAELQKELNELIEKQRKYESREQMLKEMRAAKLKASKEKQAETKRRHEEQRKQKAEAWKATQAENIVYLGEEVSKGLNFATSDREKLQKYNLPYFENVKELAEKMGISLAQLRFLTFYRKVAKTTHYAQFSIPKKSGGTRQISAPKRKLKKAQKWLLENVLYKVENHQAVHGFVPKHSIKTNAEPHLAKAVVINLDLKDFFPSIHYKRVKGLFLKLGYSEQVAIIFALLCTQAEVEKVSVDGQIYYVQTGQRFLPQGSPASPAITTLICRKMDLRLQGVAKKFGFTYTRYADDLTFSAEECDEKNIAALLFYTKKIIESEQFTVHPEKTHVMRKGAQKKVTGIVVNEKPNIDRKRLRQFRALLHQVAQTGWAGKKWGNSDNIVNSVVGYANFVAMVNPEKGKAFQEEIKALLAKFPYQKQSTESVISQVKTHEKGAEKPIPENKEDKSGNDWWDVFERN